MKIILARWFDIFYTSFNWLGSFCGAHLIRSPTHPLSVQMSVYAWCSEQYRCHLGRTRPSRSSMASDISCQFFVFFERENFMKVLEGHTVALKQTYFYPTYSDWNIYNFMKLFEEYTVALKKTYFYLAYYNWNIFKIILENFGNVFLLQWNSFLQKNHCFQ